MQRVRDGNWVRVLAGLDQWLRGEGLEQEVLF
jgi:hypothetical protein